jgi:peroxiredoxin
LTTVARRLSITTGNEETGMPRPTYTLFAAMLLLASPSAARPPKVGDVAPPFELKLDDGSKVTLDDLRGNVIVLNFWATWCVPCLTELPLLDAVYANNSRFGLSIYPISSADSAPLSKQKKALVNMRLPWVKSISGPYAVIRGLPTNYVIDRSGRIRVAKAGAFNLDELNELLVPLLQEPRPAAPAAATPTQ